MAPAWKVPGLTPRARFRDAAGRIILTRWAEMMSHRAGVLEGDDIEHLHAMRVSSRRLRSAMDAFGAAFPADGFKKRLRRVKEITDTLGGARDLDVAIAGLLEVLPEMSDDERAGIEGLVARYREDRAAEDAAIAGLFARVDQDDFASDFIAWVERHTGVTMAELRPRAPGEED